MVFRKLSGGENMGAWESYVRRVVPYVPGEQPARKDIFKLNTNENPYPPCPAVVEALRNMDVDGLRRYPAPDTEPLRTALADTYGLKPQQVFVGVGSDDVLAMCFLTFFQSDRPVLFPDITYSFYDVWAELFRISYQRIPLDEAFRIRPDDYRRENGGVIFPNPNAPTGELLPIEQAEEIIRSNPDSVVIVDEAYIDFGGDSVLPLLDRYDNLLVVQTFSKSRSLAGLRIGYAMGSERMIRYLEDVKYSFNSYTMNAAALKLGTAALSDPAYYKETSRKIIATREKTAGSLRALGFTVPASSSNFLFVTHPTADIPELFEALKRDGIYVRHWNKPRIDRHLRITIGTDEEMERLVDWLKEYLS